jgi:hypothetical protein
MNRENEGLGIVTEPKLISDQLKEGFATNKIRQMWPEVYPSYFTVYL